MADTGDRWPTPDRGRRIKPDDLRVECWACGGSGQRQFAEPVGYGSVSIVRECNNPLCEKGWRRPFKALR